MALRTLSFAPAQAAPWTGRGAGGNRSEAALNPEQRFTVRPKSRVHHLVPAKSPVRMIAAIERSSRRSACRSRRTRPSTGAGSTRW